jgi:hypothetical protein
VMIECRGRTLALAVAGLVLASGGTPSAARAGRDDGSGGGRGGCRVSELSPVLGSAYLAAGDPTGRYVIGYQDAGGKAWFVITDGQVRPLDTEALRPYEEVGLAAVNERGDIVGARTLNYSDFHHDAFLYRDGQFTLLPPLRAGDATYAGAINANGDVAGYSVGGGPQRAVVWPAANPGTVRALTVPGEPDAITRAIGIDDDGTVLGYVGGTPGHANYVWPPRAAPYELIGPPGSTDVTAVAIRNGWVAGSAPTSPNGLALRWNLRQNTLKIMSDTYSGTLDVNRRGDIAATDAIIHHDGRAVPLPGGGYPIVLTDRGTAYGYTYYGGHALRWTGC